MRVIVTGGAGFIGSMVARHLVLKESATVIVYDKLTYAGNMASLEPVSKNNNYNFVHGDICDKKYISSIIGDFKPDVIMNLAAESHVDRSIDSPGDFINTNIVGTFSMLVSALDYWKGLRGTQASNFKFIHISTDEVFGSLGQTGLFCEDTPYSPNSPYSASKAASDHLVRAWRETYGLPTIVTNCSNNYGPYHFPEKLIPLMIINALEGKPLPIYGNGKNVRDWLFVEDHAKALTLVAQKGKPGESYNIGGNNEKQNIDVVNDICNILDKIHPRDNGSYRNLITFVQDRPGHDLRYAIDSSKIERELGWRPAETFESGLRQTILWYMNNPEWWQAIRNGKYRGERLGQIG